MFSEIGRGTRITVSDREEGDVPLITAGEQGQGITEYIKENKELFNEDAITIDMFGNTFYRGYEFFADDNIIIVRNNKLNRYVLQYICGSMQWLKNIYSYSKQFRMKELNKTIIELPVLTPEDTTPYWDYMAYYIYQIQQQYADQLEAKSEYELDLMCKILGVTREDIDNKVEFTQPQYTNIFTVGELFEVKSTKKAINKNTITDFNGKYPYVTRKEGDNGIESYINEDEQYLNPGNTISLAMDTYVLYYQQTPYFTGNRVKIVNYKGINKENALYIITALNKTLGEMTWGETMNMARLNKIELELPVLAPNSKQIDWGAISNVIIRGESPIWLHVKRYATEILR